MPNWKKVIISGSNISQLNNDSSFLTSLSGAVLTSGNQNIAGNKTFTGNTTLSGTLSAASSLKFTGLSGGSGAKFLCLNDSTSIVETQNLPVTSVESGNGLTGALQAGVITMSANYGAQTNLVTGANTFVENGTDSENDLILLYQANDNNVQKPTVQDFIEAYDLGGTSYLAGTGIDLNTTTFNLDLTEVMANSSTANAVLTSDGDGTLTAESSLTYNASNNGILQINPSVTGGGRLRIGQGSTSTPAIGYISQTSTGLYFGTGYVGISIAGTSRFYLNASGVRIDDSIGVNVAASTTDGRIDASNDIVAYSTSDERLKENVKPLENALDKVSKIGGYEFDWKELTEEEKKTIHGNEGHDVGVIAQEIEKVLPEVVTERDSGYKAVKYEKIVPLLIESIKDLKAEIEELKGKL